MDETSQLKRDRKACLLRSPADACLRVPQWENKTVEKLLEYMKNLCCASEFLSEGVADIGKECWDERKTTRDTWQVRRTRTSYEFTMWHRTFIL